MSQVVREFLIQELQKLEEDEQVIDSSEEREALLSLAGLLDVDPDFVVEIDWTDSAAFSFKRAGWHMFIWWRENDTIVVDYEARELDISAQVDLPMERAAAFVNKLYKYLPELVALARPQE